MKKKSNPPENGLNLQLGGLFGGLGELLGKLQELAETGTGLSQQREFQAGAEGREVKGVYGFSIRTATGGTGYKVEPFGNIRPQETGPAAVVSETREPLVDILEEEDHLLILAEMPGVGPEDVNLEVQDDVLEFSATQGERKYRKTILLPQSFTRSQITLRCNNGIVEIKCAK